MAAKVPHEPEEGIIELFDIVDAEDAPKDEPFGSPHADADAPEETQADASPDEDGGHVVSRYPFENGQDFLDELDKTPSLTLMPPQTDAKLAAGAEASAESTSENAGPEEPDEALVRAFEEEMAKAGAASDDDGSFPPASSEAEGPLPDAAFPTPDEEAATCDAMPEAETHPAPPLLFERHETTDCIPLAASAVVAPAEQADSPAEPLPSAPSDAENVPAEAPLTRADDGTEERITRLEEALSRLNERVSALEQRLVESEAVIPDEALLDLDALRTEKRALGDETRSLAATLVPEPENAPSPQALSESATPDAPDTVSFAPSEEAEEGPNTLVLALEALHERVALLERRPVAAPDVAGIAQDVLALVRVDMEKAAEEQEGVKRTLEEVGRRVQELEKRPLPQLILPDLPDEETIATTVMQRIRGDLDRIAAEAAARVLREEIAGLMRK